MNIDDEFRISVPIEHAWEVLTDIEGIAPCMPGAQLTGSEGDTYSGKIKLKVGPVTCEYAGTATFVEKDAIAHQAVIRAKGAERRGAGNASATVIAQLCPDGDQTLARVGTELEISGMMAQFGSCVLSKVSHKLLGQFVDRLEARLAREHLAGRPATLPTDLTIPGEGTQAGDRSVSLLLSVGTVPHLARPAPEPEAINLLQLAGGPMAKRVAPVALALAKDVWASLVLRQGAHVNR